MSLNNPLSNMMSKLLNAERVGKSECIVSSFSKKAERVLEILKTEGYIKGFKHNKESYHFEVELSGTINKCGVISPNFNVKKEGYEKYEKRLLPAKGFGVLIVTTTKGIMVHTEAIEKGLGGRLLAYCY